MGVNELTAVLATLRLTMPQQQSVVVNDDVHSIEAEFKTMKLLRSKNPKVAEELTTLVTALKRRKLIGSYQVALQSVKLFRNILSTVFFETIDHYVNLIRNVARIITAAQPLEVVSGCMARRVLAIMREYAKTVVTAAAAPSQASEDLSEAAHFYANAVAAKQAQKSAESSDDDSTDIPDISLVPLNQILNPEPRTVLSAVLYRPIRSSILDDINTELIDSLQEDRRAPRAAGFAEDHIHNKQVIFTYGFSHTVLHFLKVAAWGQNYQKKLKDAVAKKKRDFEVVVSGLAPVLGGQKMAQHLAAIGIQTTVVPDASMFTIMARVHKVITGTHAIMANGALLASAGTRLVALAAKHFSVPCICVTGLYKVAPTYP